MVGTESWIYISVEIIISYSLSIVWSLNSPYLHFSRNHYIL